MTHLRALIIGHGSIGARHARVLSGLGLSTAVVSRRTVNDNACYETISIGLDAAKPDYVVVADETARHHETLSELAECGFAGRVLVEKPLFHTCATIPFNQFDALAVGYQLRFHPAVGALRARLAGERSVMALIDVGQHLSTWRPGRDWCGGYSASRDAGGGVLRDLSHELDLLLWLFGPWRRIAALGGGGDVLEITAEESVALLAETERCPAVSLALDYLARPVRRRIVVETARHSILLDLVAGTLVVDGVEERFATTRDEPIAAMHQAVLSGSGGYATGEEGLAVVELVTAAEAAISRRDWIRGEHVA